MNLSTHLILSIDSDSKLKLGLSIECRWKSHLHQIKSIQVGHWRSSGACWMASELFLSHMLMMIRHEILIQKPRWTWPEILNIIVLRKTKWYADRQTAPANTVYAITCKFDWKDSLEYGEEVGLCNLYSEIIDMKIKNSVNTYAYMSSWLFRKYLG